MRHEPTRKLYAYWDQLRGERAAPERHHVDPVELRPVMGDIFMLEAEPGSTYPMRHTGERINQLFGANLAGKSFLELWAAPDRQQIAFLCTSVCDDALAVVAGIRACGRGEPPLTLELLLLPLRHHGKTHARIMGSLCLPATARHGEILASASLKIDSMRIISSAAASHLAPASTRAQIQRVGDFRPDGSMMGAVRKHAHLTVYQGGR